MAVLHLSLEAARREREAAKQHLDALLQGHGQEMQAWRQHLQQVRTEPRLLAWLCMQRPGWCQGPCVLLQVLQDQQRRGEERAEAVKQRYQALLQEVLRDAVELSMHNQQLREARRHSSADATTQTP